MKHLIWTAAGIVLGSAALLRAQQHPNVDNGTVADRTYQFDGLDTVNLFNGNLLVTLPIGPSYPLGGSFSYGLTLSYNSKVWDFEPRFLPEVSYVQALADRRSNAGLGWRLTLGRLIPPFEETNETKDLWIYEAPDGADHMFYPTLHDGDPVSATVRYTRDGSYLRMKDLAGGVRIVEFPDGTVRHFGSDLRIFRIVDRFGNALDVAYPDATTWRLTDSHGRIHHVYFVDAVSDGRSVRVVDRIVLAAFGGTTATTTFQYTSASILRGCKDTDPQTSTSVTVPLLARIVLPDGSAYVPSYYADNADFTCRQGAIQSLTLPTLGAIEWTYGVYRLAPPTCHGGTELSETPGVKVRRFLDAAGGELGRWTYAPRPASHQGPFLCHPNGQYYDQFEELQNTVTTPLNDKTVHYFTAWADRTTSVNGAKRFDYGLPFTRRLADASGTRFLSEEVFDCDAAGSNCVLKRSKYVRFEREPVGSVCHTALNPGCVDANRRLVSERTLYHDDGGRVADLDFSRFDGLGHYRQVTTGGSFSSGNVRISVTDYNPQTGVLALDPATNQILPGFTMLDAGAPWVLDTFASRSDTEGTSVQFTEICHDPATGFLARQRIHKSGSAPGANDVLVVYASDGSGNVGRESYHGGELQSLAGDTCTLTPPPHEYLIDHTYQYGSLASSQYKNASGGTGGTLNFKTLDNDIDAGTGLVKTSRDTAGLATTLRYDALGRLTWIQPAQGAWTQRTYVAASSPSSLARADVDRLTNGGGTVLARSQVLFDALGRPWREREQRPGGSWATRETLYNAMGLRASVSEMGAVGQTTRLLNYDAFGRPGVIRPPDGSGHDVVLSYLGDQSVSRTIKVGRTQNAGTVNESPSTSEEIYDRQGRLWRVREPAEPAGTNTTTTYTYDAGNRLTRVSTATSAGTQNRSFGYDGRGFLSSETHPEKGPSGNGTVTYSQHDSRGHARRKVDGANALSFSYDRAERLFQVKETTGAERLLKEFVYATGNGGGDFRNGKLVQAKRHNHHERWGLDVVVTETYTYGGLDGRVSRRDTASSTGQSFTQSWTHHPLGASQTVTYPTCTHAPCSSGPGPLRTVSYGYGHGLLTAVGAYATSISYHPNGLVHQIVHGNGVTVTQANDPYGMRRPASISTAGATINWTTGTYQYDGAGNVVKIGPGDSGQPDVFLYDGVSRLTQSTVYAPRPSWVGHRPMSQNYTYDPFANVTQIATKVGPDPWQSRTIAVSPATNRLTAVNYDASGNQLDWGSAFYTYDRFDRMKALRGSGSDWVYLYTADDQRIWSYDVALNKSFWRIRDLGGKVLREYVDNAGTWSWGKDYVYRDGLLLASESPAGARHFHLDHLGSPRLVTGVGGQTVARHAYHPYGEEATDPDANDEPMKFTGHERDLNGPGTGDDLDYMLARHFNPLLARFLSVDPALGRPNAPQSWNRYAYTEGNPLKYTDPSGQWMTCGFGTLCFDLHVPPEPPPFEKEQVVLAAGREVIKNESGEGAPLEIVDTVMTGSAEGAQLIGTKDDKAVFGETVTVTVSSFTEGIRANPTFDPISLAVNGLARIPMKAVSGLGVRQIVRGVPARSATLRRVSTPSGTRHLLVGRTTQGAPFSTFIKKWQAYKLWFLTRLQRLAMGKAGMEAAEALAGEAPDEEN